MVSSFSYLRILEDHVSSLFYLPCVLHIGTSTYLDGIILNAWRDSLKMYDYLHCHILCQQQLLTIGRISEVLSENNMVEKKSIVSCLVGSSPYLDRTHIL